MTLESRESQTVLDDERSNEIGSEGGASGLVFFGMQVEPQGLVTIFVCMYVEKHH
jgi:hypothetical protein